jgi:hypothetical protein
VAAATVALLIAPSARAAGPALVVGAAEDDVKAGTLAEAKAKLDLLRLAGLEAVRVTAIWDPADPHPSTAELEELNNLAAAAKLDAIDVFVSVYNFGSRTTPFTSDLQASFANFAAELALGAPDLQNFIIGNEPNLNRFWLPQFNPDGTNAAAPAYLSLLARTYSALKAADSTVKVFGGAISPRGIDRPGTGRDTHSPTVFIQDLGTAYRASGLTGPVMDALAIHPYPENSEVPPTFAHLYRQAIAMSFCQPNVVGLLVFHAFDETALDRFQSGLYYPDLTPKSSLPVVRDAIRDARGGVIARCEGWS